MKPLSIVETIRQLPSKLKDTRRRAKPAASRTRAGRKPQTKVGADGRRRRPKSQPDINIVHNEEEPQVVVCEVRKRLLTGNLLLDQLISITTGKALPGQKRMLNINPLAAFGASTALLALAVTLNIALIGIWGTASPIWWPVLLCGHFYLTLATVGRLRSAQVATAHYAIHNAVARKRAVNNLVATIALIIPVAQHPEAYKRDHLRLHHGRPTFATKDDPDASFLDTLGFQPGMTKAALWQQLWKTLVSPKFHYLFLKARLFSALVDSPWKHRSLVLLWLGALAAIGGVIGPWAFLITILLPLTFLYHISALLQFVTEHRWRSILGPASNDQEYADLCTGRFCGEMPPAKSDDRVRDFMRWSGWAARMAFLHVPTRMAILVGDLPVHDAHHLVNRLRHNPRHWRDGIFLREQAIQEGDKLGLKTREQWGLAAMLNWVFEGYENSKPTE